MKNGFKALLGLALTSTLLVSAQALAASQPRHMIFMVHGIGGDKTTFNQLEPVLKKTAERIQQGGVLGNTSDKIEVYSLEYTTKSDSDNVYTFSKQIDAQMQKAIEAGGGLKPQDKISLIAHSQGGLVSSVWLFSAAGKKAGYHSEYFPNVKSFITLGTPFWGSRLGNAGFIADFTTSLLSGLGTVQLENMSFESSAVDLMRNYALRAKETGLLKKIFTQVKMVNVAGNKVKIDNVDLESDGAVSVYSARMDFLHGKIERGYDSNVIQEPQFERLFDGFAKSPDYVIVSALHTQPRLGPDHSAPTKVGIATGHLYRTGNPSVHQVANDCMNYLLVQNKSLIVNKESTCASPSFSYIVGNVMGMQNKYSTTQLERTNSFWIEISAKAFSKDSSKPAKFEGDLEIEVLDKGPGKLHPSVVEDMRSFSETIGEYLSKIGEDIDKEKVSKVGAKFETASRKEIDADGSHVRKVLLGTTLDKYDATRPANDGFAERQVMIRISAKGFKPVMTYVTVKPTFTTYLKLDMDQE